MDSLCDCLLIGPNEMPISAHEKLMKVIGCDSAVFKTLNLSVNYIDGKPYRFIDLLNFLVSQDDGLSKKYGHIDLHNRLSATIAYLGSYLDARGYTFDYINSFQDEKELLINKLINKKFRAIVITTTIYITMFPAKEIITLIRKYNKDAVIIIGGPYIWSQIRTTDPSLLDQSFRSSGADIFTNSHQGEATLVEILAALRTNSSLESIDNILYFKDHKLTANPTSNENNPLAENMVNWPLFKDRITSQVWVRTAISCMYSCSYCEFPARMGKFEAVSLELIEKELNQLSQFSEVKSIRFIDDTFNVPVERFNKLLDIMIKNRYHFKWNSYFRCQHITEEIAAKMVESGCEGVYIGIESGDDHILDNMNKGSNTNKYRKGLEILKKYSIPYFTSYIIGFPGETDHSINRTKKFINDCKPDFYQLLPWYCSTLTPIWQQRNKYGIEGSGYLWRHNTMDFNTAQSYVEKMYTDMLDSDPIFTYLHLEDFMFIINKGFSLKQIKNLHHKFNEIIIKRLISKEKKDLTQNEIKDFMHLLLY